MDPLSIAGLGLGAASLLAQAFMGSVQGDSIGHDCGVSNSLIVC